MSLFFLLFLFLSLFFRCLDLRNVYGLLGASHLRLDRLLDFLRRLLELGDAAAQGLAQVRQPLGAENDKGDDKNNDQLGNSQTKHNAPPVRNAKEKLHVQRFILRPPNSALRTYFFSGLISTTTLISRGLPWRNILSVTVLPICPKATILGSSEGSSIFLPSSSTITSPRRRPAFSAGDPLTISVTNAPIGSWRPAAAAISGVTCLADTPSQPMSGRPFSLIEGSTFFTMLMGMENPRFCPVAMMTVLIPTTPPLILKRGPPLFPGLMAASVWISSSYGPMPITRPFAETMPAVTGWGRPEGVPRATAH